MPRETSRSAAPPGAKRGSFTVARTRASHGSWSRPTRTSSAADRSRASCPGLTSTAWGSWSAGARLSTRTRSPPTASTSALRSVEVATTSSAPPPHAGAAASRTRASARSTYDFLPKIDFGIMQCTPLRTSTTCDTRQSAAMELSEYAS
jgi:hypothetical protein